MYRGAHLGLRELLAGGLGEARHRLEQHAHVAGLVAPEAGGERAHLWGRRL